MQYRRLGRSNLIVSAVGLGTFNTVNRPDAMARLVSTALDVGVNLIDTAETYGNGKVEEALGAALAGRRRDAVLATKWGGGPRNTAPELRKGSRGYIARAVEGSLTRLRTDYIDLYQYHHVDPETPIEETLAALQELVVHGKIRYAGVSNMTAEQLAETCKLAAASGFTWLVTSQDRYSLLARRIERDLLPVIRANQMSLLPYYPLERGLLTGKYRRGAAMPEGTRLGKANPEIVAKQLTPGMWDAVDRLTAFAAERGRSLLELAISWLVVQPTTGSVIAGATRPEQIEQNAAASGWALSAEDIAAVAAILR